MVATSLENNAVLLNYHHLICAFHLHGTPLKNIPVADNQQRVTSLLGIRRDPCFICIRFINLDLAFTIILANILTEMQFCSDDFSLKKKVAR